jgi:hypothetical protein
MSSALNPNQIKELSAVLCSLARLIAGGSRIDDDALSILILGARLPQTDEFLDELRTWVALLEKVRTAANENTRKIVKEALKMRGLDEVAVTLAVMIASEVKPQTPTKAAPVNLKVSQDHLEMMDTPAHQKAQVSFRILAGGPGKINVENDQVAVRPRTFGAAETLINVEVTPPQVENSFFSGSVELVGDAGEHLDVGVVADWAASTPQPREAPRAAARREAQGEVVNQAAVVTHEQVPTRIAAPAKRKQAPVNSPDQAKTHVAVVQAQTGQPVPLLTNEEIPVTPALAGQTAQLKQPFSGGLGLAGV